VGDTDAAVGVSCVDGHDAECYWDSSCHAGCGVVGLVECCGGAVGTEVSCEARGGMVEGLEADAWEGQDSVEDFAMGVEGERYTRARASVRGLMVHTVTW
jgi:hypothetical protein